MDIQKATAGDLEAIGELADQINMAHHRELPGLFLNPGDVKGSTEFWSKQIDAENSVFLLARLEGAVVGFITASIRQNTDIPFIVKPKVCRIGTIVTRDGHQNKGIGGELMRTVEQWAAGVGAKELRLEVMEFNDTARSFYENKGYIDSSRIMAKVIA